MDARFNCGIVALELTTFLAALQPRPLPATGPLAFLRTLLRMQTLHCMARALAVSTDRALPGGGADEAEAVEAEAEEDGVAGRITRVILALTTVVSRTLDLLTALTTIGASVAAQPLPHQAPAASAAADKERRRLQVLQRVFAGELVSALADSGVMEHLARAVLVIAELAGEHDAENGLDELISACLADFSNIQSVSRRLAQADPPLGGTAAAARLFAALQHPCVLHLELTSGLVALCLADGGPSHGLPQALLEGMPVLTGGTNRPDGTVHGSVDARGLYGRQCVNTLTVTHLVDCLTELVRRPHGPLALRPAAAAALLLRLGRWAVASGRAWAEPQQEAAPPPLQLLLERKGVPNAFAWVIDTLDPLLTEAEPGPTGGWAWRAAVARWILVVEACRHVLPASTDKQVEALAELWSGLTAGEVVGPSGTLPPEPPAQVAAALAAGLLPCLERLLRRGGKQPAGREALLAARLLNTNDLASVLLARLLAYGEPAEAAALVTTIDKLLRLEQQCTLATVIVSKVHGCCRRLAGPEPSAAPPQLRLMLLRSAAQWLPPMARHAQQTSAEIKGFCERRAMQKAVAWANVLSLQLDSIFMWISIMLGSQSAKAATAFACGSRGAAGGVAADGGPSGDGSASGDGGWRRFLVEELQVLPLLGSLLRDMAAWSFPPSAAQFMEAAGTAWHKTVFMIAAVAMAMPEEVRQAAKAGAAAEATGAAAEAAAAQTRAAGGRGPRRGRGSAKRTHEGGDPAAYWPPEMVEALAEKFTGGLIVAGALASLLRRWAAGEDAAIEAVAVQMGLSDRDEWLHRWGPLPPLASVRALLPSCAHPRCTRLDGDSEGGRELRRYPGCGEGAYCSAACAQQHRAGAAAGGSGAGPGGSGRA